MTYNNHKKFHFKSSTLTKPLLASFRRMAYVYLAVRLSCVLVAAIVTESHGQAMVKKGYEHTCDYDTPQSHQGVCGSALADLLQMVCEDFYGKRSGTGEFTHHSPQSKQQVEGLVGHGNA